VGTFKKSAIEIHHAALALWTGRSLTHLVTECLKNRVGRLRPDFLSRCRWDTALAACTGKADSIRDGRESFPSGHSSTAFAGMTFLALWIAGQTAAWCFSIPTPSGTLVRTRMCRFVVCLLPLAYSTWVAISRLEDYRHHKEDIIVGALIGALCSSICYFMYWPSPFSAASFNSEQVGRPRVDYAAYDYPERRSGSYQLTRLQDDTEHV
ncbi:phosphatidic acid phosphatase, partial [Gloeophyllum trabeum ATCC 11539]